MAPFQGPAREGYLIGLACLNRGDRQAGSIGERNHCEEEKNAEARQ